MNKPQPFILVIFGGSGDLAWRKLIPAMFRIYRQKLLPEAFAIVGLGRKPFSERQYRDHLLTGITARLADANSTIGDRKKFLEKVFYQPLDIKQAQDFVSLAKRLREIGQSVQTEESFLFYLATPPEQFQPIADGLAGVGLNQPPTSQDWRRLVIEKPFGHDRTSARVLNKGLLTHFREEQIFRIDHYLGKETVQNILAFRFANGIFEPLWNHHYVHHVEITAAENIGVRERGGYYDHSGALRDMVQNHLLQIAATIAMEPPVLFDEKSVRDEKVKVFRSFRAIDAKDVAEQVIRGQYIASTIRGEQLNGYRQEKGVDTKSHTETFAAMKLFIDNWRWNGTPFYIRTGKRLPTRVTEAVVHFKKTPHHIFTFRDTEAPGDNQLVLRIQPDEGILLKFGMKVPGGGFTIRNVGMDFHYSDLTEQVLPEAYERLLLDALNGDATLFARADAVEEAWKIVDPILTAWRDRPDIKLYGYPAGTWGPKQASQLFGEPGYDWRYPCKNLTGEDTYCEL